MKKILVSMLLLATPMVTFCQVKVNANGRVVVADTITNSTAILTVGKSSMSHMKRVFVSIIMMLVAFMANAQSCPDDNHPHAIDLGLPSGTKWACCNVGATTPEGYGDYFAWGETEKKEKNDWTTYIHCDGSIETCHDLGSDIAGTKYDVAHVQWCSSWVMPSQDQIKELCSKCSYIWTIKNNSGGVLFTGPSGATIFLPEVNEWREGRHNSAGRNFFNDGLQSETDPLPDNGYYWSSTQRVSNLGQAVTGDSNFAL